MTTANHSVHSRVMNVAAAATGSDTPCACAMSSLTMPISCTPSPPGRNDSAPAIVMVA